MRSGESLFEKIVASILDPGTRGNGRSGIHLVKVDIEVLKLDMSSERGRAELLVERGEKLLKKVVSKILDDPRLKLSSSLRNWVAHAVKREGKLLKTQR